MTGPVMGITLVLVAVFLPAAFLPGITGQLFRQFALVIAATAVISAINALTLKPAQCALWLRPQDEEKANLFSGASTGFMGSRGLCGPGRLDGAAHRSHAPGFCPHYCRQCAGSLSRTPPAFCPLKTRAMPSWSPCCLMGPPSLGSRRWRQQIDAMLKKTPGVKAG